MSEPILIWGAGAIGGTLGAYWARAGHPVLMVDLVADHVRAISAEGLSIEGPVAEFRQQVDAVTPDALTGVFKRIVLVVKAQHTAEACRMLLPHLAEDGFVLSAQNGLNELEIASIVGRERTMGAFVNFGADWIGPGRVLYGNRGAVVVGEVDGSIGERTRAMHALLRDFDPDAILTDDIWSYLWGKLAYGAMLYATALNNDSMSDNFADPHRFAVFNRLGREVCSVAAVQNVKPRGFNGFDPSAFTAGAGEAEARRSIADLAEFNRYTAKTHSGIWRDLAVRKRRTEVDAQLGIICELARDSDIATPVLAEMIALIHRIEDGKLEQGSEAFDLLLDVARAAEAEKPGA
ncbi:2-dehydropantoate 2-reductase [Nitratireductor sp. GZWM139]|uniref:ketopantoate reductase family protein n=1 Tax=Nitratireductor sp. GZWM139 TaxID=2950541 RepID=UPI0024BECE48|nr:2-dehydropantoate 2-reductase [Nitratireductor sp. GZWM139]MDJ1465471.1 2-dehydropantoate 2-reductase [Nitratireductor sp. GZWM139]